MVAAGGAVLLQRKQHRGETRMFVDALPPEERRRLPRGVRPLRSSRASAAAGDASAEAQIRIANDALRLRG
eukprot:9874762-Heterocapsa_arctica.AAC.1